MLVSKSRDRFVSNVDDFICAICYDVPAPQLCIEHSCGSLFCYGCLDQWKARSNDCPCCKKPLRQGTKEVKTESKFAYKILSSLQLHCDNFDKNDPDSCTHITEWSNLEAHTASCPYTPRKCRWNCGLELRAKLLIVHEAEECSLRLCKCQLCGELVVVEKMEHHLRLECERNPERMLTCPIQGCGTELRGDELEAHIAAQTTRHLLLMQKAFMKSEQENVQLRQRVQQLENALHTPSPMKFKRTGCAAVVQGNSIFVLGGSDGTVSLDTVEKYDYNTNSWSTVAPMNSKRQGVAAVVHNNTVYALGGSSGTHLNTAEMYNPLSNTWSAVPPMNAKRQWLSAVVCGNAIYAVGGRSDDKTPLSSVEQLTTGASMWCYAASMTTKRFSVTAVVLNNMIYAIGGHDDVRALDTVERYDPATNRWQTVCSMNRRREGCSAAVLNNFIFVLGGYDGNTHVSTCERYDPITDTWTNVAPMKSRCNCGSAVVLNGCIYALGGYDGKITLDRVEKYNPVSNLWV